MKTRLIALTALLIGPFAFTACERHSFKTEEVKSEGKTIPGPGGENQTVPGTSELFKKHGASHEEEKMHEEEKKGEEAKKGE